MNKLNPIKYIENMLSHHPKSISLWITEGIVINGERYIIKEFRLRDGSLYAVIAENKYTPKYFEVKLAPDEETLKDIYKAIEENKIAIEKEVTDRKNEIARVDNAIKANTTKIEQEIADRKSEIARVDKAIEANTAKIDKEIADRENEIERVDKAIEANTEKINQEITDRQNEITRVDNAINANTAKIDKEIQDRKNEITRVDGAINANTEKINQEITDRTNEINRVDGKITDLEDKLTTSDVKIAELDKATKDNKAKIDQEIIDRKREIDRVDEATKANKATIDQEIANRRDEINRVDQAIEANTTKINKEISDRQNEITRVDGAISANTAKIDKEITDRKSEIARVDKAIAANTTKINQEITDRQNEISRVDGSINANTAKINKEIQDRKDEITRVEGKITTNVSTRNLILKSNDLANPHKQGGNANTEVTSTNEYFILKNTGYTYNSWGGMAWNMSISEVKAGEEFSILMPVYIDSSINLDSGFSFNIKNHTLNLFAYDYSIPTNTKDQWFNVAITFKVVKDVVFDTYPFYVYLVKNGLVRIKPPMLVRGNLIPLDYQPAFEDNILTSINTVNLIRDTGSSFVMGYGITNTTWNETKKQSILDFSAPGVNRANGDEILPQGNKFFDFKPIKGTTYTQSMMIDTDATFNPNGQALCTWFTTSGHNEQKAYIRKVGDHSYQVWSTYTWNLEDTALRAFDWKDLHNILLFRTTGTYLAFYKPKMTTGNLPSAWSPALEDNDSKLDAVKSEIKQTTDSITTKINKEITDRTNINVQIMNKVTALEEKVAELQSKAYKKMNIETTDYTGYYSVYDGKVIKYDVTAKDGKYLDLRNFTFSDGKDPIKGVTFDSNSLSVIYKVQNSLGNLSTYDNFAKFSINNQNKIVIDPSSTSQLLRNNLDKVTSFSYVTMDPNYEY